VLLSCPPPIVVIVVVVDVVVVIIVVVYGAIAVAVALTLTVDFNLATVTVIDIKCNWVLLSSSSSLPLGGGPLANRLDDWLPPLMHHCRHPRWPHNQSFLLMS
jgi:hypothetical protein